MKSYRMLGQVINVPVSVDTMVNQLPRSVNDDFAINVCIKRSLTHKTPYLCGQTQRKTVKAWLEFLVEQPLYVAYGIEVDLARLDDIRSNPVGAELEELDESELDCSELIASQQTLLWNEDDILKIAPGQNSTPLSVVYDRYSEELSFPDIYDGVGREFTCRKAVTHQMMANSEIRRSDRRGARPEHIFFMAIKLLRYLAVEGLSRSFRCVSETENITRTRIEDPRYFDDCVEQNLAFLKTIPKSVQYWRRRRRDLFAMTIGQAYLFHDIERK